MDDINPNELPPLDITALEQELRKEEQYGERPVEAFAGEALSTATLGLSDVALRAAGVSAERLREVREREPEAAGAGLIAGAVGPAIATMGTSAAAQAAAAPARLAGAVGKAAEGATKALMPTLGKEGAKRAVAETIATSAARGGAEGVVAGVGQLVQDVALEKRDLSAEAVLGTVGTGALFGAGLGTVIGTAQASAPALLKGANKVGTGLKKFGKQALGDFTDKVETTVALSAGTAAQKQALRDTLGEKYLPDLPDYFEKHLGLENLSTADDLVTKNTAAMKSVGKRLGELSDELDTIVAERGSPISRQEVYNRLLNRSTQALEKIGPGKRTGQAERAIIERYADDILELGSKNEPFSFKEIDDLRKQYAGKKWKFGGELTSAEANFANELRKELRTTIDEIADQVAPDLGLQLKELNKAYHIGNTIQEGLEFVAERAPSIFEPVRFAASTVGRVARNTAINNDLATRTQTFLQAMQKGIDDALVVKAPKGAYTFPASTILVKSQLAVDENGKQPKTKQQALQNIQKNVSQAVTEPDKFVDLLAKRTARVSAVNPELGMVMQQRLANAMNFLNSKVPKPAIAAGVFQRPYSPSSMELAKFERYVQIVEQPLSIFQEIKQDTLTREHVEALQAVYPEVYKQIQVQVMQKISEGDLKLSYARKLQLGILLNIPADSSLQPQTVLQLQQSILAQPEQQQPGPQFRPSGMEQTGISERAESATEKLTNR